VNVTDVPRVLDALDERDWSLPVTGAHVVAMLELQAQVEAKVTRMLAAFDASPEWAEDGARSAATWVAAESRRPRGELRRLAGLGRALASMDRVRAAWEGGEISRAHVQLLSPLSTGVTAPAFARDEADLVDWARELSFGEFARVVAYWRQHADPDGTEAEAARRHEGRSFWSARSFDGGWTGGFDLDPGPGAVAHGEITRLEDQLFDADWAEATERLGRDPFVDELRRTPRQRRADAFVEAMTRSAATPAGAQRPRPLLTVLVDYATLAGRVCQLADGTPLTPGALLPYLDETMIERAVFLTSKRVEISARARLFTGATRRAVEVRDQRCRHRYCEDIPAERCQCDHVVEHARGGPTTQENGRMLCGFHNRLRNKPPPPRYDRRPPPHEDDLVIDDEDYDPGG
jgi:hypothetical protein